MSIKLCRQIEKNYNEKLYNWTKDDYRLIQQTLESIKLFDKFNSYNLEDNIKFINKIINELLEKHILKTKKKL